MMYFSDTAKVELDVFINFEKLPKCKTFFKNNLVLNILSCMLFYTNTKASKVSIMTRAKKLFCKFNDNYESVSKKLKLNFVLYTLKGDSQNHKLNRQFHYL